MFIRDIERPSDLAPPSASIVPPPGTTSGRGTIPSTREIVDIAIGNLNRKLERALAAGNSALAEMVIEQIYSVGALLPLTIAEPGGV